MLAPVSPAPAFLPWALPIPLAGFSPVCKDLEMGDLPSVPPPPLPGSHWTPPSPAWGEWGWAVAVYPLSPFSTPTVKPLGGAGDGKGILLTLPGEAGWSLAPPPQLWELPGLLGLGDASKLPQKLVAKCHSLIWG